MSEKNENQTESLKRNGTERFILIYATLTAIISMILAVSLILYATTIWEEFDWLDSTLSNLGNPEKCIRSTPVLIAGYFIGSLGIFPFIVYMGYLVWSKTDEHLAKIGFIFMGIASLAVGAIALFPEYLQLHWAMAGTFFVSLGLGILLMSISWIIRKDKRVYGIIIFIILLVPVAFWIIHSSFPDYTGLKFWNMDAVPEFASLVAYMLILIVLIIKTWKQDSK